VLARSEIDLGHTKLSTRDCPSGSETKWDMSLAMSPASEPVRAGGVSRADTAPHDLGRVGKDDRMTPDKDVVRADDMSLSRRTQVLSAASKSTLSMIGLPYTRNCHS